MLNWLCRGERRSGTMKEKEEKQIWQKKSRYMHIHIQPCEMLMPQLQMCNTEKHGGWYDMKYATRPQQVEGPPPCRHTVSLVSQSLVPVKDIFSGGKTQWGKKNKMGLMYANIWSQTAAARPMLWLNYVTVELKWGNALWATLHFLIHASYCEQKEKKYE